jgi:hypothetical protein
MPLPSDEKLIALSQDLLKLSHRLCMPQNCLPARHYYDLILRNSVERRPIDAQVRHDQFRRRMGQPLRERNVLIVAVETLNLLESTMRTSPPFVRFVGGISIVRNAKSLGDFPSVPSAASWSASIVPRTSV